MPFRVTNTVNLTLVLTLGLTLGLPLAALGAGPSTVDALDPECDEGGGIFCSVASALAAASPGDTIRIVHARDTETIVISIPGVALEGVDGSVIDVGCAVALRVEADDVRIEGLTIDNAATAILAEPAGSEGLTGVVVERTILRDVGSGVVFRDVTHGRIVQNTLSGSTTCEDGDGIVCDDGESNSVLDNHVSGFDGDGIAVDEVSDRIWKNVSLENGSEGFRIRGDGHEVDSNESSLNGAEGFQIDDDVNDVRFNLAHANEGEGFKIEGERNLAAFNEAWSNDEDGFLLDDEATSNELYGNWSVENGEDGFDTNFDGNLLVYNHAIRNGDEGFEIEGDDNELRFNVSSENAEEGFELDFDSEEQFAERNILIGNEAQGNDEGGFDIEGDGNALVRNRAIANGRDDTGDGYVVEGSGNSFEGNLASRNVGSGFHIHLEDGGDLPALGADNVLTANRALHNGVWGYFDESGSAVTNQYEGNICAGNAAGGSDPADLCAGNGA